MSRPLFPVPGAPARGDDRAGAGDNQFMVTSGVKARFHEAGQSLPVGKIWDELSQYVKDRMSHFLDFWDSWYLLSRNAME